MTDGDPAGIECVIDDPRWAKALGDVDALAATCFAAALAADASLDATEATVAALFADDDALAALNERFRGRQGPTNVLSFPADADSGFLGDIALSYDRCAAEAEVQDKTFADHVRHLIVHGVLHLIGYDHETDEDAHEMESLEIQVLKTIGVDNPYAEGPNSKADGAATDSVQLET